MPTTLPAKNGKQHAGIPPASAPAAAFVDGAAQGGKKKKKKKGKGRAAVTISQSTTMHDVMCDADDDDDLPTLEPCLGTTAFSHARTGLSPDLESVHLSTTASLASLSAAVRQSNGHNQGGPDAEPAKLLAELYRKIGFDAAGAVADEVRGVRESFDTPPSVLAFMQSALAGMNGHGLGSDEAKQRALYAIAQELVRNDGAGTGPGTGPGGRTNGTGRNSGSPAFDSGAVSELAITQVLERLVAGNGTISTRGGQAALHANLVLSHEYIDDEEGVYGDEVYSDDEGVEQLEMHMDMERMRAAGLPLGTGPGAGQFSVSYEEELLELPGAYPATYGTGPGQDNSPRKKNKKKKRKGSSTPYGEPEPGVDPGMEPEPKQEDVDGVTETVTVSTTVSNNSHPIQQPIRNPSAMPPRAAVNPPPSSRAAGKQPMSYAPTAPAAANPPAATNPPRSARAAAKAPAPPQSYPNHNHPHHHPSPPSSNASAPQKHRPPASVAQNSANVAAKSNSKIWSTNTTEERERIKEFWLGLGENERRALVKVEKEAVLRKMKEQQKHSCTCAVCGRKRNAIEEELEVLYDAYYEELEQYANYQQRYASSGGTLPPPPGPGPFPGSVELDKNGLVVSPGGKTHSHPPTRVKPVNALANGPKKGTVPESEFDEDDPDGDDYEEEEYDDDDEDEEEDEEDDVDADDDVDIRNRGGRRGAAPNRDRGRGAPNGIKANGRDDLFNFGSSLTVAGPGNILTVADDLLKNDGQKFLEMMEQLAERRMQREEEAAADVEEDSEEDEEDEGDEDDDGEDDEDDEDDDEEEEMLTEEQKMEEGKRMFSIFAARMFEQRVLGAYREKVAQERQMELLREEEAEEAAKREKELKKAKENQKKKDKKRQQKMAKEEERASKAAERAADEAAQRERQRQQEEEQRKKKEEERLKREAARKALEEEKQRKDEERRKRLAEEKEIQIERERKRRLKEELMKAERRDREEKERRAREEREARLAAERAAEKAKKEQQDKEEREKRQKEREEKMEREAKERLAQQQQQRAAAAKARAPSSPRTNAVASGSQRQQPPATTPKKILNKPSSQPAAAQSVQPTRQPPRPVVTTPVPQHAQSSQHSSPIAPTNLPPSTPIFPQPAPLQTPMLSPRASFAPAPGASPYGAYASQMPGPPLGQSAMPRVYGGGPPFDPGFSRGLAPAAPIGPKLGLSGPLASPIMISGPSVPSRRMSTATDAGPGPITRPIAPIARPTTAVNGDAASGSGSGSGGASPRRSPSPKGVLGSSALAADDDEVVTNAGRRVAPPGPVGQGWHSPRASVAAPTPWGTAPPTPGFSSSPRSLGGGNVSMNLGLWGPGAAPGQGNPNPNPNPNLNEWHPHPGAHFFGAAPFIHHSHSTATPPPHSSGN